MEKSDADLEDQCCGSGIIHPESGYEIKWNEKSSRRRRKGENLISFIKIIFFILHETKDETLLFFSLKKLRYQN